MSDDEAVLFDEVDISPRMEQADARVTLKPRVVGAPDQHGLFGERGRGPARSSRRARLDTAQTPAAAIEDAGRPAPPALESTTAMAAASGPRSRPGVPAISTDIDSLAVARFLTTAQPDLVVDGEPVRRCSGCATEVTFGWSARSLKPPPGPVGDCRADTADPRPSTSYARSGYADRVTDGPQTRDSVAVDIVRKAIMSGVERISDLWAAPAVRSAPRTRG